jgi:hypothetical protein
MARRVLGETDVNRNMRAVAHAIAQHELDGITVPSATVTDLHRVACGEISIAEARANVLERVSESAVRNNVRNPVSTLP